jgi:hypothetical protein
MTPKPFSFSGRQPSTMPQADEYQHCPFGQLRSAPAMPLAGRGSLGGDNESWWGHRNADVQQTAAEISSVLDAIIKAITTMQYPSILSPEGRAPYISASRTAW